MKKKICIMTATRAEYGLLKPLIKKLQYNDNFDTRIVVTGAHLCSEFGFTYKEIENDGFVIDEKIDILLSSDSPSAVTKTMGLALISFASYFERLNPDLLIILGDRYETLAVSVAAFNQRIPIAHLHGGEITEGALDDSIRHSITKLSYIHFTSTEVYRQRVIQLGENPKRVFNVGAIGIENIKNEKLLSREELFSTLKIDNFDKIAIVTYHPVTLEKNSSENQINNLLEAITSYKDIAFIITKANADSEGRRINKILENYIVDKSNLFLFDSLGVTKYLSGLKYCEFVIGNSSSGIIEAPSFKISTINIGNRQNGRIQANSIINCDNSRQSIQNSIDLVLSKKYKNSLNKVINPYGDGEVSSKIIKEIERILLFEEINIMKQFYDI
ncbi:UDP-N-acetylglucosamine 2-epimerase (hydrolyzing) [bacterium]|nr:UDP-N-acetylglucosamine 2-epimerase (hydrolyzing) [bacterium]